MRILSFVFVLFFAIGISAQSAAAVSSFNEGMKAAASGEFEKALTSYRTARVLANGEGRQSELSAKLHFNIGVCLYRTGRAAESIAEFEESIRIRKGNYQKALYALGMAEAARENWVRAGRAFEAAIKLKKDDGEAWFDLAMVYLAQSDFDKAETAFRNSIAYRSTDSALSHNNIGVILAMKSDFSLAEKEFETALSLSAGRLVLAKSNLEYCRARNPRELLAKLVFSGNIRNVNHE